jgi:hypothetical protein
MEQALVKPMSLGEMLDSSVRLYRRTFIALVIAQLPMTILYLGSNVFNLVYMGTSPSILESLQPTYTDIYADLDKLLVFYTVYMLLMLIQVAVVQPMTMAAMTKVASDSVQGNQVSVKEGYWFYLRNWLKLGITSVAYTIALVIIGIIIFILYFIAIAIFTFGAAPASIEGAVGGILIIGGILGIGALAVFIFFWVRLQAVYPAAVNEGSFMLDAMRRSWDLVKGDTRRVSLVLVLAALIPYAIIFTPTVMEVLLMTSLGNLMLVAGALSQGLLMPLVSAARVVVYFELRARKEGLDLEERMKKLSE